MSTTLPDPRRSPPTSASRRNSTPAAMAEAARAGFRSVVNNRPDFEGGPDQPTNAAIEAAARAAGLEYRFLPVQRRLPVARGDRSASPSCWPSCRGRSSRSAARGARSAQAVPRRRSAALTPTRAAETPRRRPARASLESRAASSRARRRYEARRRSSRSGGTVAPLLTLSRLIDAISEFVGRWLAWLVLAAVLISAANAIVRKAFNTSSNAWLEIQWYLFAAVFLLAAGYTLLRQEHVQDRRDLRPLLQAHADLDRHHRPRRSSCCRWSSS